jgi:hypothetical protein
MNTTTTHLTLTTALENLPLGPEWELAIDSDGNAHMTVRELLPIVLDTTGHCRANRNARWIAEILGDRIAGISVNVEVMSWPGMKKAIYHLHVTVRATPCDIDSTLKDRRMSAEPAWSGACRRTLRGPMGHILGTLSFADTGE